MFQAASSAVGLFVPQAAARYDNTSYNARLLDFILEAPAVAAEIFLTICAAVGEIPGRAHRLWVPWCQFDCL